MKFKYEFMNFAVNKCSVHLQAQFSTPLNTLLVGHRIECWRIRQRGFASVRRSVNAWTNNRVCLSTLS